MPLDPTERALAAKLGAHKSWSQTRDPAARTAAARAAKFQRFEHQVDPEGVLPAEERHRRAKHAEQAFMTQMSLAAAKARRRKREAVSGEQTAA